MGLLNGEPYDLETFTERQAMFVRAYEERKGEIDALRERIAAGWEKVNAATANGAPADKVDAGKAKLAELEAELAKLEKAIEIPWYIGDWLIHAMRDCLQWVGLPEGAKVRVVLPGVMDVTVKLAPPDEIAF